MKELVRDLCSFAYAARFISYYYVLILSNFGSMRIHLIELERFQQQKCPMYDFFFIKTNLHATPTHMTTSTDSHLNLLTKLDNLMLFNCIII